MLIQLSLFQQKLEETHCFGGEGAEERERKALNLRLPFSDTAPS